MVTKCHTIPENRAITWLVCLSISILADNVLNSIKFATAMVGVDDNLRSTEHRLLASVHQVVCMYTVLRMSLAWSRITNPRTIGTGRTKLIELWGSITGSYSVEVVYLLIWVWLSLVNRWTASTGDSRLMRLHHLIVSCSRLLRLSRRSGPGNLIACRR